MSERETPHVHTPDCVAHGCSIDPIKENARLKDELEEAEGKYAVRDAVADRLASRVTELEAKLADERETHAKVMHETLLDRGILQRQIEDVSEHAEYEQRRAEGAVAELVEVHAKLAEARQLVSENTLLRAAKERAERALVLILSDNGLNSDNAALARDALHTDHPLRVWDRTCPACQPE
jgi:hypothetical protein